MEDSKKLYEQLTALFPREAMSKDDSRGFKLTSIKAQYVRERLNEVMGVDGWETQSHVVETNENGDVAVILGLTLHFPKRSVTRTSYGGAKKKAKGQTFGDIYKSAETDALSKAASNFGVGNDVFKGLVDPVTLKLKGTSTSAASTKSSTETKATARPSFKRPKTVAKTAEETGYGDDI